MARAGVHDLDSQLIADEGRRLDVYPDSLGNATCGIGHKVRSNEDWRIGECITDPICDTLFEKDKVDAQTDLDDRLHWWRMSDPVRVQGVLMNLCFNMGITRLLGFKLFLSALRNGQWETAAAELLNSHAYLQEPHRIERLAEQVRSGKWQ